MSYHARITGTGCSYPEKVMTNADFESFVETSDEWIRTRTGIESRRICDPKKGETTGSLALEAARRAVASSGIRAEDVELIIVATVTPDSLMPTTANAIQAAFGATKAFSFDMQAACSGFVYALSIANNYVKSGAVKNAVVVGAETLSILTNWRDRSTCVLFGDAAGAVVLERTDSADHAIVDTILRSDGGCGEFLTIEHGYGRCMPYMPEYSLQKHKIKMAGSDVFKMAVRNMVGCSEDVLAKNGYTIDDVDFFLFHQANIRIIDMCLKTLKIPREKTWVNLQKYGNTSAATLPVCLDEATRAGAIKSGDLVLMATFGGGVTWGSALIRI